MKYEFEKTSVLIGYSLIVLALLLFLILLNLRSYYDYGFGKYQVAASTGLDREELNEIADSLTEYFNLTKETPKVFVVRNDNEIALFGERELVHLEDVRQLIILGNNVQITCMLILFVAVISVGLITGARKINHLFKPILNGCVFTVCAVLVVGLASSIDFNRLFIFFHIASFSNDYWVLDPSQHYLIRLFPQGFFSGGFQLDFTCFFDRSVTGWRRGIFNV